MMAAWPWRSDAAIGRSAVGRCPAELSDLIVSDPGVMSGTPSFRGTRVPVSVLFENLAAGISVEEVMETWPGLDRADVLAVLELAGEDAERRPVRPRKDWGSCRERKDLSDLYRDYIACLNKQDWPEMEQFVHDDVYYNDQRIGLSGYREMLERDFHEIPDLCFKIQLLISDPPYVASRLGPVSA
jgi:uncharacterized protein (DUF433 family)